jgi:MoaA/NifB/PqqE/SkfB family radical SAM enzyme
MSNFYCAAPWRGLHINPRGDVKTCCAGDPNMLGNLNDLSIDTILDGSKLQEIRQSLASGQAHAYCYNCVTREQVGGQSERDWHNTANPDFDPAQAGLAYHYPVIMDVRWNITCNLSCNYCGPDASSKWAKIWNLPIQSETRHYFDQVCKYIEQHKDHIKEVALVGGEPLLLKENSRLLDVIPDSAQITVITNLNNDLSNNEIFQKLSRRPHVGWSLSFENIEKRFEYVRHGGDWDLLMTNIGIIKNLFASQGHWGGIHAVYNVYNCTRLCEFKQFAQQHDLTIKWQSLYQPKPLDPRRYGVELSVLALAEIHRLQTEFDLDPAEQDLFGSAEKHYATQQAPDTEAIKYLRIWTNDMENKYHPGTQGRFAELWPELGALL